MAVSVALEAAAAKSEAEAGRLGKEVREQLQAFVVDRAGEEIWGVSEAAGRLGQSRVRVGAAYADRLAGGETGTEHATEQIRGSGCPRVGSLLDRFQLR